jgi:alpha-glucosidase
MSETKAWWRDGVIYQVYPRSFQDTTGDGVGDLRGILERLDYLVALGVDAVWVSPFYPSPMADFGYDVADYCGVDPLFGTLADFDALLAGAHQRGLKLILDFVPNHTSNQHPWFLQSRSSRTNAKRDWYLWRDPAPNGDPPNNWMSNFGGPGWTLDEATGQYYYHSFLKEQPDLNWRNPAVRTAMYGAMRFWLDKGVDGFRMDVLWLLIKDDQFRDNPVNPEYHGGNTLWSVLPKYTANQPQTLEIVHEMRALLEQYKERVLIGEIYLPIKELVAYYGSGPHLQGAQMPFNFWLIQTGWQAGLIADLIQRYEAALPAGAWPNYVLGNHDQKRLASRVGAAQARVAAMLLLTLRGTPTMYYGDELGMPDARISPDEVRDPAEKNQPGIGQGRDPERSPMLWANRENAGFCSAGVKTWLPLVWDWPQFTVETQEADAGTMLKLDKRLLALRRERAELHAGAIAEVAAEDGVLRFLRRCGPEPLPASKSEAAIPARPLQVLLNMTAEGKTVRCAAGTVLMSTLLDRQEDVAGTVWLSGNEGVVVEIRAGTF